MSRLERLDQPDGSAAQHRSAAHRDELHDASPGTPTTAAPSGAPSSATRRRSATWACRSRSGPLDPTTQPARLPRRQRRVLPARSKARSRRARGVASRRVGRSTRGRGRRRGALEARRGTWPRAARSPSSPPCRVRAPGVALRRQSRSPAGGDVRVPRHSARGRPVPPVVPQRPLVPGRLRPHPRRGAFVPPRSHRRAAWPRR